MKHLLLFCLLLWTSSISVYSQWKHIGPFRSGLIKAVDYEGSVLIGSSFTTLYRTTDGGETYELYANGLDKKQQSDVGSFTYYKGKLYAGMHRDSPYRWDPDLGRWISIPTNIDFIPANVNFVLPLLLGTDSTLIGASSGLLAWSLDGGSEWLWASSDSVESIMCLLKTTNRALVVGANGVAASTNHGREWKRVYTSPTGRGIVSAFSTADTVILALSDGTVVWSFNGGLLWSDPKGEKTSNPYMSFSMIMGKVVALSRNGAVYELIQAEQWKVIYDQAQSKRFVNLTSVNGTLYAGTLFEGIYTSVDAGRTWSLHTTGLLTEAFKKPVSDGKKIWAFESLVNDTQASNIVEIADSAVNYERIELDEEAKSTGLIAGGLCVDSLYLSVATTSPVVPNKPTRFEIMFQDRKTKTWQRRLCDTASPGERNYRFTGFYQSGDKLCVMMNNNQIMTSSNYGLTWSFATRQDLPAALAGKDNFVVANGFNTLLSTDYGQTWNSINYLSRTGRPFVVDNSLYLQRVNDMYVTRDSGNTFSSESGFPISDIIYFNKLGTTSILCTPDSGIYTARKEGDKWKYSLLAKAPARILELFVLEKSFFAFTENGFYTRPIDQVTDVRSSEPSYEEITVNPNPATESVTISVAPNTSELSIFDIRGQEVFISSQSDAESNLSLNIANLQPGCYLIVTRGAYGIAHRTFMISR